METPQAILSEITVFGKYAKFIPEINRRETWEEICERNIAQHVKKYPQLREKIQQVYRDFVIPKKVLPSMRSMQKTVRWPGQIIALRPITLPDLRCFRI